MSYSYNYNYNYDRNSFILSQRRTPQEENSDKACNNTNQNTNTEAGKKNNSSTSSNSSNSSNSSSNTEYKPEYYAYQDSASYLAYNNILINCAEKFMVMQNDYQLTMCNHEIARDTIYQWENKINRFGLWAEGTKFVDRLRELAAQPIGIDHFNLLFRDLAYEFDAWLKMHGVKEGLFNNKQEYEKLEKGYFPAEQKRAQEERAFERMNSLMARESEKLSKLKNANLAAEYTGYASLGFGTFDTLTQPLWHTKYGIRTAGGMLIGLVAGGAQLSASMANLKAGNITEGLNGIIDGIGSYAGMLSGPIGIGFGIIGAYRSYYENNPEKLDEYANKVLEDPWHYAD